MALRVDVPAELISWARERAGIDFDNLSQRFPNLGAWERGELLPTLKQLEDYANSTRTPVGYFFLDAPPDESLPIPDFRTMRDEAIRRPSPDLLDTIFHCQRRQDWYREYALATGQEPVGEVGTLTTTTGVRVAAETIRTRLAFDVTERGTSWGEAFRRLVDHAEGIGVLVMVNGVVGNNTHRKLNPEEFRGFALVDEYAPVVFVNGADTKAAQIFTLAHELAHVWLGQSALDDSEIGVSTDNDVERWCNQVAAEFLVPLDTLRDGYRGDHSPTELERLAREFKVSTLVVLSRIHDAGRLAWRAYREAYQAEQQRVRELMEATAGSEGGNFYNTQPVRASKKFTRALITSALEGQTLYRDAFQMLGVRKVATFEELARHVGVL